MKSLPIRIRLTLWYFAMFATAACLLSATSWWMLRRSVDVTEYHDLQERAEDVQSLFLHRGSDRSIADLRLEFTAIYADKDDGKWLQILDQDKNWIYRSKRMIAENPSLPRPEQLPHDGIISEFRQGTRYVRTLAYPIQVRGKMYSVQTGIALNKSMAVIKTFGVDLLLLTPVMIILAALGGHWMSRKALRPVALLAAEARHINDRNLDVRLPEHEAQDEITDLSRTLNQMLERIDSAFASVRAFTGNASHELRTPIALFRTEIEVALFRPRSEEQYKATLTHLHEEALGMTKLVENLLSIARADAGVERVNLQPVDLNNVFHLIDKDWQASMHLALLDFRTEIESENPMVLADPSSLSRLLTILLDNARKYTPAGGSVVLSAVSEGAGMQLTVRDTGKGISKRDLPRIFDRFFRGEQPAFTGSSGSGLGLALGKWIAESHGTELQVHSEPQTGSSFSFTLLRAAPSAFERKCSIHPTMKEEGIQV